MFYLRWVPEQRLTYGSISGVYIYPCHVVFKIYHVNKHIHFQFWLYFLFKGNKKAIRKIAFSKRAKYWHSFGHICNENTSLMAPIWFPLIWISRPVPYAEKRPRSMMFPPLCFKVGIVFICLCTKIIIFWFYLTPWYYSDLDLERSSCHMSHLKYSLSAYIHEWPVLRPFWTNGCTTGSILLTLASE